jgi:hypothetical protein
MSGAPDNGATSGVDEPQLRADVLYFVFLRLAGRIDALCAAACVCSAWCAVTQDARLWRRLYSMRERTAAALTDEHLVALVARAQGGLERIDVSGCMQLSGNGLADALQDAPRLSWFAAVGCSNLTAADVARALAGKRMAKLFVRGVLVSALDDGAEEADDDDNVARLARSLTLLRSVAQRDLDVHTQCCVRVDVEADEWWNLCGGLCGAADRACDFCDAFRCTVCVLEAVRSRDAQLLPYRRCEACGARVCASCAAAEENAVAVDVCTFCRSLRCARCVAAGAGTAFIRCGRAACHAAACAQCVSEKCIVACAARVRDGRGRARRRESCTRFICKAVLCRGSSETCKDCGCSVCAACILNVPRWITAVPHNKATKFTVLCPACRRKRAKTAA